MAGCGATGQKDILVPAKESFYGASFPVEELTKLDRLSLHLDYF